MISAAGNNFEIIFTANFLISSHTFNEDTKTLQFNIETGLDEGNVGEIIIPRDLISGEFIILLDDEEIPANVNVTNRSSVISIEFDKKGERTINITATKYIGFEQKPSTGGCLIATATFGSELAPQVQFLREIRDNTVLQTQLGVSFMTGFNQFYYLFSPVIADYERENPIFKEIMKITLTPLLTSLTLLQYADIDSELEIFGYGIGVILLNIGIYFLVPVIIIIKVRKGVNMKKLDEEYA